MCYRGYKASLRRRMAARSDRDICVLVHSVWLGAAEGVSSVAVRRTGPVAKCPGGPRLSLRYSCCAGSDETWLVTVRKGHSVRKPENGC
jgi:hypothetical protein